jgi:hypothetical protein
VEPDGRGAQSDHYQRALDPVAPVSGRVLAVAVLVRTYLPTRLAARLNPIDAPRSQRVHRPAARRTPAEAAVATFRTIASSATAIIQSGIPACDPSHRRVR